MHCYIACKGGHTCRICDNRWRLCCITRNNWRVQRFFPDWTVTRQADPIHLSRSQFTRCNRANFSLPTMFPRACTRAQQRECQKILSQDVKHRCSLVYKKLYDDCGGNILTIKAKMPKVLQATLEWYDSTVLCVLSTAMSVRGQLMTPGGLAQPLSALLEFVICKWK